MAAGQPTFLPTNFVTPNLQLLSDPRWVPNETSVQESNVFVEAGHDRIMLVQGAPINAGVGGGASDVFFLEDSVSQEVTATFAFSDISMQVVTGFQLEQVLLQLPPNMAADTRNLQDDLCGDLISESLNTPRRTVWSVTTGLIPFQLGSVLHAFSIYPFIPSGGNIAYI